jgi:HSP20 family protein
MADWDDPFEELERMHKRIHHLMRRVWKPIGEEFQSFGNFPVDVAETEGEVIIKVDLPGFNKDEVAVKLTEDTVDISAQHKEKKIEQTEKMYRSERKMGSFRRFLTLPAKVDFSKTDAKFENGVLTIKVPKKEKKKVGKKIEIK